MINVAKCPLEMHVQVVASSYRVRGETDDQCREKVNCKCTCLLKMHESNCNFRTNINVKQ